MLRKLVTRTMISLITLFALMFVNFNLIVFSAEENLPSIVLSKTIVKPDETVNIAIANGGENSDAWIGIYNENDTPGSATPSIKWYYLKDKRITSGSGNFDYNLSECGLTVGNVYKAVLFMDGSYTVCASTNFTVAGETPTMTMSKTILQSKDNVNVTISNGSINSEAWVGIYLKDKVPGKDGASIWWSYLKDLGVKSGSGSFDLDISKCGLQIGTDYKLILFKDNGYTMDSSVNFSISSTQMTISKTEAAPNEKIEIEVKGANDPACGADCIALFEDSADVSKDKPIWKETLKNLGITEGNGTINFDPSIVEAGKYISGTKYKFVLGKNDVFDNNVSTSFDVLLKMELKSVVIRTKAGIAPALPAEVTESYNDGTSKSVKVTWENVDAKLYAQAGSFTVKGNISGISENAKADVTVIEKDGPLFTFNIFSDTHIKADLNDTYDMNFDNALKAIKVLDTTSSALIIDGDITNHGDLDQWNAFKNILNNNEHPKRVNLAFGNHDTWCSDGFEKSKQTFMDFNNAKNVYYDYWMNGFHFIFMGGEISDGNWADLSPEQLKWLDETLAQGEDKNKPIFLFLHQPLQDTVAGSKTEQKWYNVSQDQEVKDILTKYPQTIFFTGHTHWTFGSKDMLYNEKYCTMINVPSVAYCWTDEDTEFDHSEGYFIDVYNNKILVKGRDFTTKEWASNAQFVIPYSSNTTLSAITISADRNTLDIGKTSQLKTEGVLKSGEAADLKDAVINYIASDTEVISIDRNGLITAKKAGSATIYSIVTLNGVTVQSNQLIITVKASEENKPISDLTAIPGDGQATLNYSAPIGALKVDLQYSIDTINYANVTTAGSIRITTGSAIDVTTTSSISAASTSVTVTGLANGQQYSFRLNVTGGINSGISNVVNVVPKKSSPITPPIQQSDIDPTVSSFDKNSVKQMDISVTMALNGNTLTDIKNGSYSLINGTDYLINGSVVTIKKDYLAKQNLGNATLTFNFNQGSSKTLIITVVDTTSKQDNSSDDDKGDKGDKEDSSSSSNTKNNENNTSTRTIDVVAGTNKQGDTGVSLEVVRTLEDGEKKDTVKIDLNKAQETVKKVLEAKRDVATIFVSDMASDKADKIEVQVSKDSAAEFAANNIGFKVDSEKAKVEVPADTLKTLKQDLVFDIKEVTDASKIGNTKGLVLKVEAGSQVIGNPVEVETNYKGRTKITIPLKSENLPKDKQELKKLLDSLAVFIEHSDGEKVTQKGEVQYDENGNPIGISIWVDKFSTFTIVALSNNENTKENQTVPAQVPEIKFVGLGHSPLVEGDKEDFIISSSFDGNVQYRIYLQVDGTWKEVTNGYSQAVSGKETFAVTPDYKFEKGQYQGRVYVKKAGTKGSKEENGIEFDNYYTYNINCVDRDDTNRVYTNGMLNINKDTFKLGETVKITGIDGISGIEGPYFYRLHIYDVVNDKWMNNLVPYSQNIEWTPSSAGIYVLDVHVITPNSVLWDNVQNDPNLIYGGYEGWKLKTIKVN